MSVFPLDPPAEAYLSDAQRVVRASLDVFCMIGVLPARRVRQQLMDSFDAQSFLRLKQLQCDPASPCPNFKPEDVALLTLEERADFIEGVIMLHRSLKPAVGQLLDWPPAIQLPLVALASLLAKNHSSCAENFRLIQSTEWVQIKALKLSAGLGYEEWLRSLAKEAGHDGRAVRSELERQAAPQLCLIVGYKPRT